MEEAGAKLSSIAPNILLGPKVNIKIPLATSAILSSLQIGRSVHCQFQAYLVSTRKKKILTNHIVFIFQTNCTPHLPKADKGMHSHWFPWQNYM